MITFAGLDARWNHSGGVTLARASRKLWTMLKACSGRERKRPGRVLRGASSPPPTPSRCRESKTPSRIGVFTGVEDRCNVRVVQVRRCPRLATESGLSGRVVGLVGTELLRPPPRGRGEGRVLRRPQPFPALDEGASATGIDPRRRSESSVDSSKVPSRRCCLSPCTIRGPSCPPVNRHSNRE